MKVLNIIYIYIYIINHKGFSIYKSFVWIYFFQKVVIEMLFNNKIQIFSPLKWIYTF